MSQEKFIIKDIDVTIDGTRRQHKILVCAPLHPLSYVNEWLAQVPSYNTSYTYAKVTQRFCHYLAECVYTKEEDKHLLLEFWRYVNTDTLTAWKTHRIETRNRSYKPDGSKASTPSNGTIDSDCDVVCIFLDWVRNDMHVHTRWDGKRKYIKSTVNLGMMKGLVGSSYRDVVSANTNVSFSPDTGDGMPAPIEATAKRKQGSPDEYLFNDQISQLITAFADPVYACITLTGYLTGVRPHEALAIPYFHKDRKTNLVFSADPGYLADCLRNYLGECPPGKHEGLEMKLRVLGKRRKIRTVNFAVQGWLTIMRIWAPLYAQRKELYKRREGKECPPWILWLTKNGTPLYCPPSAFAKHEKPLKKVLDAFYNVSSRGKNPLNKVFNHDVSYYTMRHTFATNFMVQYLKNNKKRAVNDIISDMSLQRRLADQMGHDEFDTTFKHYVVNAVAIMLTSDKGEGPREFCTVETLAEYLNMRKKQGRRGKSRADKLKPVAGHLP